MAMAMNLPRNMGVTDRTVRSVLGGMLLMHAFGNNTFLRKWETIVGGAFLANALTGFDPVLALLRASTKAGDDRNVMNLMKQSLPGHGDKPMNVQQPFCKRSTRKQDFEGQTMRDALAVR